MRHEHGIKARARMNRVIDGDTVEVIVQYPVKIRLRNCWAPELHGDDKIAGQRAKEAVEMMAPSGTLLTVWIPTDEASSVGGVMTFDRVLGDVWIGEDEESLNEHLVAMGHATREKRRDN